MSVVDYSFLNWEKMSSINDEKIRADLWKLDFVKKPAAIPFPPDDYIQARCTGYDFQANDDPQIINTVVRGFSIIQSAPAGSTDGMLSLMFEDFSDQSLTYCFREWKRGAGDYATRMSLPKQALTANINIYITDVNKVIIRTLKMYDCIIESCPFGEHGSGEGSDTIGSSMGLQIHFAYWERIIHNVSLTK